MKHGIRRDRAVENVFKRLLQFTLGYLFDDKFDHHTVEFYGVSFSKFDMRCECNMITFN